MDRFKLCVFLVGLDLSLVAFWCGWKVVLWLGALVVWLGCSVRKGGGGGNGSVVFV